MEKRKKIIIFVMFYGIKFKMTLLLLLLLYCGAFYVWKSIVDTFYVCPLDVYLNILSAFF